MSDADADRKALILAVSAGLFGRRGLPLLAYYMYVSPSTLRRWLSPSGSPPPDIGRRLHAAIDTLMAGWAGTTAAARVAIDNHEIIDSAGSPELREALKAVLEDTHDLRRCIHRELLRYPPESSAAGAPGAVDRPKLRDHVEP